MLADDQISIGPNNNDNTDDDMELDELLTNYQTKNKRPQSSDNFPSNPLIMMQEKPDNRSKFNENRSVGRRIQMPRQFQKAKRTCNKIVNDYFNQLKQEYERCMKLVEQSKMNFWQKKNAISFYLKKDKIQNIIDSVTQFTGIHHKYKDVMDLKFNYIHEVSRKNPYQTRRGTYCYLFESQKILGLNLKGQILDLKLTTKIQNFKYPQHATPIPYKDTFFFLDPSRLQKDSKVFLPDKYFYKINDKCQIQLFKKQPICRRIKCAITRDSQFAYLFGGMVGVHKHVTNSCEKFNMRTQEFQSMPKLKKKHRCPSVCILKNLFWLFSVNGIQYLDKLKGTQWTPVQMPFQLKILPFQFVAPYSETQIVIFGGVSRSSDRTDLKIYNTEYNWVDTFHEMLPMAVNSQKVWGPSYTDSNLTIVSTVEAENWPNLNYKDGTVQAMYFTPNGIILHGITVARQH